VDETPDGHKLMLLGETGETRNHADQNLPGYSKQTNRFIVFEGFFLLFILQKLILAK
jgi:hypothetical protein